MTEEHRNQTSLNANARTAMRRARALTLYRRTFLICPPAASVANRVAGMVGDELARPGDAQSLLVAVWTTGAQGLRAEERRYGLNDPRYLVCALQIMMAPLDAVLGLRVADANGEPWRPEDATDWWQWRSSHPGELTVRQIDPENRAARRVELERRALGSHFTDHIRATRGWPDIEAVA